jgi:response regulator RpfG family c-di-GMP phosphodiesterase
MTTDASAPLDKTTVLILSDDEQVVGALPALLTTAGYRALSARSLSEGLRLLTTRTVDVIVSDLRVAGLDAVPLLQQLTVRMPKVPRLLLVSAAEQSTRDAAISRGQVFAALAKPWHDAEVLLTIQHAMRQRILELELDRLQLVTQAQRKELDTLKTQTEQTGSRIAQQTEELKQTVAFLELTQESLKKSYVGIVQMCASLIGLRDPAMASHARAVAEHARTVALRLGMDNVAAQDVLFASLLHHIGKLALPDHLLNKPFEQLSAQERAQVSRYPIIGESLLVALEPLQKAASYIRSQNESFNGQGWPDGLAGDKIPLGGRILAVVKGYHAVQRGSLDGRRYSVDEAQQYLRRHRGSRYDPAVVDAYLEVLEQFTSHIIAEPVECLTSGELLPGMVLARDMLTDQGAVLLTKDNVLTADVIERIRLVEKTWGDQLTIFVWRKTAEAA